MRKNLAIFCTLVLLVGCSSASQISDVNPQSSDDTQVSDNTDRLGWGDSGDGDTGTFDYEDDDSDVDSTSTGSSTSSTFTAVKIITRDSWFDKNALLYQPYEQVLAARGGSGSYVWNAEGLPSGLSLQDQEAEKIKIKGKPAVLIDDPAYINVEVCDAEDLDNCDNKNFVLNIKDNIAVTANNVKSGKRRYPLSGRISGTTTVFVSDGCNYINVSVIGHVGGYTWNINKDSIQFLDSFPENVTCFTIYSEFQTNSSFSGTSDFATITPYRETRYLYVSEEDIGREFRNVEIEVTDSKGQSDSITFEKLVFERDPCGVPLKIKTSLHNSEEGMNSSYLGVGSVHENFVAEGGVGPYHWEVKSAVEDYYYCAYHECDGEPGFLSSLWDFEETSEDTLYVEGEFKHSILYCDEDPVTGICEGEKSLRETLTLKVTDSCPSPRTTTESYIFNLNSPPEKVKDLIGIYIYLDMYDIDEDSIVRFELYAEDHGREVIVAKTNDLRPYYFNGGSYIDLDAYEYKLELNIQDNCGSSGNSSCEYVDIQDVKKIVLYLDDTGWDCADFDIYIDWMFVQTKYRYFYWDNKPGWTNFENTGRHGRWNLATDVEWQRSSEPLYETPYTADKWNQSGHPSGWRTIRYTR